MKHQDQMFLHDCEKCIFLGHFVDSEMDKGFDHIDFWACPDKKNPDHTSLICRFSDAPNDYASLRYSLAHYDKVLSIAKQRYDLLKSQALGL